MKILSDPVTVTEERFLVDPLYIRMRRREGALILKSGNLLCMARLGFRVKRNNQFGEIPQSPERCLLVWSRHFLWNSPVRMNYTSPVPAFRSGDKDSPYGHD